MALSLCSFNLFAQNSGVVYFMDGSNLKFNNLYENLGYFGNNLSKWDNKSGIHVDYQNTSRFISFDKIESIEIIEVNHIHHHSASGKIKVITTTGAQVISPFEWQNIGISIYDNLTGELIKQQVWLAKDGKLNLSKIVFDKSILEF